MRLMEADLARHWTLASLADELHLTPKHLVRLFKAATGLPPMAYLARVRAERAAVLVLHSDEPMTGIGAAVGWGRTRAISPADSRLTTGSARPPIANASPPRLPFSMTRECHGGRRTASRQTVQCGIGSTQREYAAPACTDSG